MTMLARAVATLSALLLSVAALASEPIPVRVSEPVELMSIVFRLAGAEEYSTADSSAAYVRAVDERFGRFKDHEVVRVAKDLREDRGVSFDAVMSFAVHLASAREPALKMPVDRATMDARWRPRDAERFLNALRDFVRESDAAGFFDEQAPYYAKAGAGLAEQIGKRPYRAWMDEFFGVSPGLDFVAIVGLLNGSGSYGVSVRYPDGRAEICPVIGAAKFGEDGMPVFGEGDVGLIVHEFSHTYTNPLVDRHRAALLPSAERIYPRREALMKPQAYGSALTMLYESMVRACSARFFARHGTQEEYERQIAYETQRGFLWTRGLADLLGEYESSRGEHPTLDGFMPRIAEFFEREAKSIDQAMARLPKVVRITPPDGAKGVDPATAAIVVEFDRPMRRGSASVVGNPDQMPKTAGQFAFSDDGRTFTLPVALEPGREYSFGLNSVYRGGFRSEDGWPLDPVSVRFRTRE